MQLQMLSPPRPSAGRAVKQGRTITSMKRQSHSRTTDPPSPQTCKSSTPPNFNNNSHQASSDLICIPIDPLTPLSSLVNNVLQSSQSSDLPSLDPRTNRVSRDPSPETCISPFAIFLARCKDLLEDPAHVQVHVLPLSHMPAQRPQQLFNPPLSSVLDSKELLLRFLIWH